jgi:hypothetical protein
MDVLTIQWGWIGGSRRRRQVDAAGYLLMHAPIRRPALDDDEEALLAWFFLEVMND